MSCEKEYVHMHSAVWHFVDWIQLVRPLLKIKYNDSYCSYYMSTLPQNPVFMLCLQ